ncbi:glycosyltransferase involved in cell wall biosynthesis [Saccharothrix ecbatanensis]|uniref:Glycosyltransferase involved in cell wall biosynthesis n=1 Tax=Saccharothrix ecbatanensis TaxID=1105145 RepID=A0A7W9M6C4_9PSEU|nr:glycosyltransferase family 4 protein [Saccharothrix ecbatanensis]MBB5808918.1 glycosyltransferase involved in cell wall biosynthesis [Saccharothrix ecbatanensis]
MSGNGLRVALLCYRGAPHCGGQGVYVRHLSRELTALGHRVEVIAGPPYPRLDRGVRLTRLPGLELFAEPNPFRKPALRELRRVGDWVEYLDWRLRGRYSEPLAFSLRALAYLRSRRHEFDVVHDNQGLGYGLLGVPALGLPLVATVHHPITIDRDLTLQSAEGEAARGARRWYGFTAMQHRVARTLPAVLTVSTAARVEITRCMGVPDRRISVVHPGVDRGVFFVDSDVRRVPGRIVTTASADVPLKGLRHLVAALPDVPDAELVVVGRISPTSPTLHLISELGLRDRVTVRTGLDDVELADLLRSAQVVCVPSLFEGFALPAVEAMACGTPLVTTTAGALPEVVGAHGECALLVPPADPAALAKQLRVLLEDDVLRTAMGTRAAARSERFSWTATAAATADVYRALVHNNRKNGATC